MTSLTALEKRVLRMEDIEEIKPTQVQVQPLCGSQGSRELCPTVRGTRVLWQPDHAASGSR